MNESIVEKELAAVKPKTGKLASEKALPQSAYDTLIKIIKGYAVASNGGEAQVNYRDVAGVTGLSPSLVSGNNSFLSESQFITSPKYGFYLPSEGAVRFARESAWGEEQAKAHLRKIVGNTWYGTVTVQNFALRSSLTREDLMRSLAIKCGATDGDATYLERLLGFIIYTGLVAETEQGLLVRGNTDDVESVPAPASKPLLTAAFDPFDALKAATPQVARNAPATPVLSIHLHIHSLDELTDQNALKIKSWLQSLNECGLGSSVVEISQGEQK
jgi:hypothetical protein